MVTCGSGFLRSSTPGGKSTWAWSYATAAQVTQNTAGRITWLRKLFLHWPSAGMRGPAEVRDKVRSESRSGHNETAAPALNEEQRSETTGAEQKPYYRPQYRLPVGCQRRGVVRAMSCTSLVHHF